MFEYVAPVKGGLSANRRGRGRYAASPRSALQRPVKKFGKTRTNLWSKTELQSKCSSGKKNRKCFSSSKLRPREAPLFENFAHRRLGLSGLAFRRSTSSNRQNRTPEKCEAYLSPGVSYNISVWLWGFIAEFERKSWLFLTRTVLPTIANGPPLFIRHNTNHTTKTNFWPINQAEWINPNRKLSRRRH